MHKYFLMIMFAFLFFKENNNRFEKKNRNKKKEYNKYINITYSEKHLEYNILMKKNVKFNFECNGK